MFTSASHELLQRFSSSLFFVAYLHLELFSSYEDSYVFTRCDLWSVLRPVHHNPYLLRASFFKFHHHSSKRKKICDTHSQLREERESKTSILYSTKYSCKHNSVVILVEYFASSNTIAKAI